MTINRLCIVATITSIICLSPNRATADDWSPAAAAKALDARARWWLQWPSAARGQGTACISCHTTLPYALARPALGVRLGESAAGALEKQLIDNVRKRVENWDKIVAGKAGKDPFRPFYAGQRKESALGTEAVVNALVLVNFDKLRAKGVLNATTTQALDRLWEQQQNDGAWLWLDFGLRPWETEAPYFGASLAALAVGMAGDAYSARDDVKPKVATLKRYLTTQFAKQPLHHRMAAVWAASALPGVVADKEKKQIVTELLSIQEADGGWRSARLGAWKSHGVSRPGSTSDGYATGFAVLTLKKAGLKKGDARLQRGIAWLIAQQKAGVWPGAYLNRPRDPASDVGQFMSDAATAFASLALLEE